LKDLEPGMDMDYFQHGHTISDFDNIGSVCIHIWLRYSSSSLVPNNLLHKQAVSAWPLLAHGSHHIIAHVSLKFIFKRQSDCNH